VAIPSAAPVASSLSLAIPVPVDVPIVAPAPATAAAPDTIAPSPATAASAAPERHAPTKRPATAAPATATPETAAPETAAPGSTDPGPQFVCCLRCAGSEGRCPRWLPVTGHTMAEAEQNTEFTFVTKGVILLCAEKTARCRERRRPAAPVE